MNSSSLVEEKEKEKKNNAGSVLMVQSCQKPKIKFETENKFKLHRR